MDRAERTALFTAVTFLGIFFGLLVYAAKGMNVDVPTCITDVKPFTEGKVIQHAPNRYEIHYLARMWYFEPSDVEIPAGSTVDIYLTSADVIHGFHIDGTNVNLMAIPGTVAYARVKFDKPGVYHIVCHEYCGIGHQDMATKIVVK
ncbi:cytochrome c oxidase subunit II [Thermocrinis albus DSM 14484]|uniref:Cytochrome c oxidase subunit II n=1 Tax=Thermocrinis albus (strain DSM 14484 / JCM 11386 / HI 11/12) TaxID=638303 RepID=D3SN72_THEAH|nr:cytochrome c oxidase subunit II [Thermocrinis albus]ADC90202.1 cytochrome c oxidase subunit II [Thermocrinis albus DSM 14484]